MCIACGRLYRLMPECLFDDCDRCAIIKRVGSMGMSEPVRRNTRTCALDLPLILDDRLCIRGDFCANCCSLDDPEDVRRVELPSRLAVATTTRTKYGCIRRRILSQRKQLFIAFSAQQDM